MSGGRSGANGDAEGDLFEKAKADLSKGTAAIVPVNNVHFFGLVRDSTDLVKDDKVGRKAAFEFVMVFFVQISIVDVEIGKSGLHTLVEVGKEIGDMGPEKVRTGGVDLVAQHIPDNAVEFAIVDGSPEGVFGARVKAPEEEIEITLKMIGEDEEPKLVGGPDIQDAFETEGSGRMVDFG